MRHLAVFGDVHGHLRLMFQLCRLWQKEHRVHLDAILQCGDLGFFPDPARADKATRRHARHDPEELAFADYFALPTPPQRDDFLERTLKGPAASLDTVRCPVIWCRGNHEDFDELDKVVGSAPLMPVDVFGRLYLLRCGHIAEVAGIRIAAVGGAPETEGYEARRRVSEESCQRLVDAGESSFDVLISHGSPRGVGGASDVRGSDLLRAVVKLCQPAYHFYAHHKEPIAPAAVGRTQCFWLNDVHFERKVGPPEPDDPVKDGGMGVLYWGGPHEHRFEIVRDYWMNELTWSNRHRT